MRLLNTKFLGLCGVLIMTAPSAQASASADYESVLPPPQVVREVMMALPQTRSQQLGQAHAGAKQAALNAGQHEWQLRLSQARRTELGGEQLRDKEISLERGIRWFGKAKKDQAIGEQQRQIADLTYADGWHETGRQLLDNWFATLLAINTRQRWQEQVQLSQQLLAIADKRVKAGEAAQLELLMADTEQKKTALQLEQAMLEEEQQKQELALSYPGLPAPAQTMLPIPQMPDGTPQSWLQQMLDDNHEIELAEAEAQLHKLEAERVAAERMPDPVIGIRATSERSGQEKILGISISIPLSGDLRRSEASSSLLRAQISTEKHQQIRIKVEREARRTIASYQQAYTLWQSAHAMLAQSQLQLEKMIKAYQLGEASLSDTLQLRKTALDALTATQSAQIDALYAHARLALDSHALWGMEQAIE